MKPSDKRRRHIVSRALRQLPCLKETSTAVTELKELSYTHRKEYCCWITEAKKEETRLMRLEKAIEMLKKGVSTPW